MISIRINAHWSRYFAFAVLLLQIPIRASQGSTIGVRIQSTKDGYLKDLEGNKYPLEDLKVIEDLISGTFLRLKKDSHMIFRADFSEKNVTILAQKDPNGNILDAELATGGRPQLHYVKTPDCGKEELVVYTTEEISKMNALDLSFGHTDLTLDAIQTSSASNIMGEPTTVPRQNGKCSFFRVLRVGIVYDSDFCRKYGGHDAAEERILLIVAAASLIFESELCIKLRLADLFTPDNDCDAESIFGQMSREKPCGSSSSRGFIHMFRDWIDEKRQLENLDQRTTYHAFTGYPPRGVRGCAYRGTACLHPEFAIGVDYMSSSILSTQAVIFAHEFAHNLNASHMPSSNTNNLRYIMKETVQDPHDGFSQETLISISQWLSLDEVEECSSTDSTISSNQSSPMVEPTFPTSSPSMPATTSGECILHAEETAKELCCEHRRRALRVF